MAGEADIDARPIPIANKDAARIFIGIPFCQVREENDLTQITSPVTVMAPMAMVPMMPAVPMAMMPAVPMTMVPAVPMTMVPVMVMPAHLHRLHLIDFVLGNDGRLDADRSRRNHCMGWRYGRSLRACGKQDRACDQTSTEFQEIPKFHDVIAPFMS